mgnify:CR=1 FL=1
MIPQSWYITGITFLNNILTSDITKIKSKEVAPSALLSPQGRILFDILISLGPIKKIDDLGYILIECEVTQVDDLFKKIAIYNLRKEVIIEKKNLDKKNAHCSRISNILFHFFAAFDAKYIRLEAFSLSVSFS